MKPQELTTYHEAPELLSEKTKNMHRALLSLREELEAVDWYEQRAEACSDPELRAVLVHNKNEEVEHAMMILEWIRRQSAVFDTNMAKYLRSSGPIAGKEAKQGGDSGPAPSPSLGIGSLKGGT